MRSINLIIIHSSAVRPYQESGVSEIDRWHKARGWKNGCGFHFVIRRDGTIELGRPLSMEGAHCKYHNRHSIGICYEGGLDMEGRPCDTRTRAQRQAMRQLLGQLHSQFPKALIMGHNVFAPSKVCPGFNAAAEYRTLQPR